jgi:hypothetical protein
MCLSLFPKGNAALARILRYAASFKTTASCDRQKGKMRRADKGDAANTVRHGF